MGLRNLRAICPNCGAKIHTQPKGLGKITWMNSGPLSETGKECPECGVALTGKVKMDGKAELAEKRLSPFIDER
jgi:ribosomal protein S27AE